MDFSNVDLALGTLTAYDSGSSVSSGSLAYAVGTAVLSQSLDLTQQMGTSMIQMMEHSVNPELGGNIDIEVRIELIKRANFDAFQRPCLFKHPFIRMGMMRIRMRINYKNHR